MNVRDLEAASLAGSQSVGPFGRSEMKLIANDNEMSDLQRIAALEVIVVKTRTDLARVEGMLRLTPTKPRLKKQKGAIEKIIFLAQAEIAKLRIRAKPPKAPTH